MKIPVTTGYLPFGKYRTFYRISGFKTNQAPLLLLHGGPGSTHQYFEHLDELAVKSQRQLIMYDQLGCGRSSRPDQHPDLYQAATWIAELINLRQKLGLVQVHLLGQSWGGMLAIMYLCDHAPTGIKSVILSSTLSNADLWQKELHRLLKFMPQNEQQIIRQAEEQQDFTSEAYLRANQHFMELHCQSATKTATDFGQQAYLTAWGPNEYHPSGNLRNYNYTAKLVELKLPALIISGTDDLCTPLIAKTMFDQLPQARWELFAGCRHLPFIESPGKYQQLLSEWLQQHDF